ncbi:hypothetical protein AAF712_009133 [Marasmius tenuissimus]|uniref:Fork-head domain-containing protein n=1 Tax=Marasmius tenuissimus TaxID=585030 RepID=A0ABR2ZRF3_9AGAR
MNSPAQQWQPQWDPRLPTSPAIPRAGGDPDHTFQGEPAHPFPCYPLHHQSSSSSESGRSSTHHPSGPTFTQSQSPGFSGHDPEGRLQALVPAATHAAPSNSMRVGPPTIGVDISLAEAESRLRRVHNFRPGVPLALSSIPDPPPSDMHQDTLVQIAIWSSPQKRLLASEIYAAIEARFRSFPEGTNQPWRRSVRHMLSFKRAFVKSRDKDHSGRHYWELDYEHLDQGYKRERKRGGSDTSKKRGKNAQRAKEDSPDSFLQDYLEDDSYFKEDDMGISGSSGRNTFQQHFDVFSRKNYAKPVQSFSISDISTRPSFTSVTSLTAPVCTHLEFYAHFAHGWSHLLVSSWPSQSNSRV